ncbi:MAG TPA: transcriptional regulator, partial [Blastocatellia bacterium]|nr:transcriptional regulator [Blastocatellia bacterium]
MTIPTLAALCDEKGRKTPVASHTPIGVDQMQIAVEDPADDAGLSALRFGRFRVFPKERALFEGDKPVRLGGRALEILIALLERHGQLLSKDELMERVWPKIFVQPSNLTVHIAALRRALKDGQDGTRWIVNTVGRGYAFVGPVVREGARVPVPESGGTTCFGNLPSSLAPLL